MIPRPTAKCKFSICRGLEPWRTTVCRGRKHLKQIADPIEFDDSISCHHLLHQWRLRRGMNLIQVPSVSGVSHQLSETFIQRPVEHQIWTDSFDTSLISKGRPLSKGGWRAEVDVVAGA